MAKAHSSWCRKRSEVAAVACKGASGVPLGHAYMFMEWISDAGGQHVMVAKVWEASNSLL